MLLWKTFGVLMVTQDNPTSDSWVVPINDPLIFDNPQNWRVDFVPQETIYKVPLLLTFTVHEPFWKLRINAHIYVYLDVYLYVFL